MIYCATQIIRHAGLYTVHVSGGGVAETRGFYDAANALGMLVYREFWMTGDDNGRWGGEPQVAGGPRHVPGQRRGHDPEAP